jgi:uncharacterized membrane protein
MKKIPLIIIAASFLYAFYFYRELPTVMVSHWGTMGEPNGYSSKSFALFFMPILSIVLYLVFLILPHTDPYRKNFREFEKYFNQFIVIIFSFLLYIYLLTIFWNLNYHFNLIQAMSPALAILFYFAGVLMSHAKRNWFVGIRTPWTLSSDLVWKKTHHLGALLFKLSALLCLFSFFFPDFSLYFILFPILLFSLILFIYSYVIYQPKSLS